MSFYPSTESLVALPPGIIFQVRISYRSIISQIFYLTTSVIIYIILVKYLSEVPYIRWLAVVPVGLLLNIFRTYYNDIVRFEHHKITQHYGRLALNYEMPSIKYVDIRVVNVDQDIFGRIFDYGNVQLGCAGGKTWEMTIHGVRAPSDLAHLIEDMRLYSTNIQLSAQQQDGMARASLVSRE